LSQLSFHVPEPHDREVERALSAIRSGASASEVESETLDCKEDPSRRLGEAVVDGQSEDDEAARLLAEACACLANHDGGAVIVGLADQARSRDALIGTDLDPDWLRNRIRELTLPP
jgi:ATP-dependent DNA helicase RecG